MENPNSEPVKLYIASLSSRLLARIVDFIIINFFHIPLRMVFNINMFTGFGIDQFYSIILSLAISMIYEGIFLTKSGQTPGKMLLRIKVVSESGHLLSWNQVALRVIVAIIPLEFLYAFFNPKKQTIHDVVCHSVVINAPKGNVQWISPKKNPLSSSSMNRI